MSPRPSFPRRPSGSAQAGVMLLEALVAILIFAIGVLSLVGLQVTAVKQSSDAKYRIDASLLANDLIGRMWGSERTAAALATNFASPDGAAFTAWLPSVAAALPGVDAHPPTVTVAQDCAPVVPCGASDIPSSLVTVSISWKAPNEPAGDPVHSMTVVTRIK